MDSILTAASIHGLSSGAWTTRITAQQRHPAIPGTAVFHTLRNGFHLHQSSKGARAARAVGQDTALGPLPDKKKALYSHSLPSIELWLISLGFYQSKVDRSMWLIERPDWHGQLNLDLTELHIKYLKSGPGSLEKDVERKFSYALSREDLDNAILGGP